MIEAHGISVANRERLEALHRRLKGPFSVSEAAAIWSLDATRARRLVAYLAARGWLSRVRRDSYTTVPLGATSPKQWREVPGLWRRRLLIRVIWAAGRRASAGD